MQESEVNKKENHSTPPKTTKRNSFGLIEDENTKYVFNEDGSVNWRKMIKPEFLVPHKQIFQKRGKPVPENTEGLSDNELLILLGGIKEIAQIRGYSKVRHVVSCPSQDYVVSTCHITWIPNYETEGREVEFSAIGDASPHNTTSFGKSYLGPFAENRAFVRAVRNFLKINIVSQEEINGAPVESIEDTPQNLLKETMDKYGISFLTIKNALIKDNMDGANDINDLSAIPKYKQFELVERIKKKGHKKIQNPEPNETK